MQPLRWRMGNPARICPARPIRLSCRAGKSKTGRIAPAGPDLTPKAAAPGYCTWASAASNRSRAFFGSLVFWAGARSKGPAPTWITMTMPMATCGVHLMP